MGNDARHGKAAFAASLPCAMFVALLVAGAALCGFADARDSGLENDAAEAASRSDAASCSLTLRFDASGGEGEMPDMPIEWHAGGGELQWSLPACPFLKDGCTFAGWAIPPIAVDGPDASAAIEAVAVLPDGQSFTGATCKIERAAGEPFELDLRDCEREGAVVLVAVWGQDAAEKDAPADDAPADDVAAEAEPAKDADAKRAAAEDAAAQDVAEGSLRDSARVPGASPEREGEAGGGAGGFVLSESPEAARLNDDAAFREGDAGASDAGGEAGGEGPDADVGSVSELVLQPDEGKALVMPAGSVAYEQTARLMATAAFSHASVRMTAVSNGGGSKSATANTTWASVNTTSGDWCLYNFAFSISGGGTTGGIQYQFKYLNNGSFTWTGTVSNGSRAVTQNTPSVAFKIWLTGNYASAYTIDYNVHGFDQSNNVPHSQNGAEASDAGAAIDGLGLKLIPKSYKHYVSVRYENADGSWGSYSTARTSTVAYGSTVSAWSRAQDATYQAASMSSYTAGFADTTKQVSVYRRTATNTIQVRYQNADGTWGDYSNASSGTDRVGATRSWSRAQDATYQAASASITGTATNQTKQVSVYRRTATNTIQARYENADGTWGSYSNVSNGSDRVGQVRSWSRGQDATYQAASASITGTATNQTKQVSVYRRTATNTVQVRYQNADGSWGAYSNASSGADRVGATRSWSRAADATYKAASASIAGTATNQTKQVSVERKSYTTSFDTQGGSEVAPCIRLAGAKFAAPDEPAREGFVFEGWWTAADGGTPVTSATDTPSGNVTYYAHWAQAVGMPVAGLPEGRRPMAAPLLAAAAVTCLAGAVLTRSASRLRARWAPARR